MAAFIDSKETLNSIKTSREVSHNIDKILILKLMFDAMNCLLLLCIISDKNVSSM